eukprot:5274547-Amphidinium_carterae.1
MAVEVVQKTLCQNGCRITCIDIPHRFFPFDLDTSIFVSGQIWFCGRRVLVMVWSGEGSSTPWRSPLGNVARFSKQPCHCGSCCRSHCFIIVGSTCQSCPREAENFAT